MRFPSGPESEGLFTFTPWGPHSHHPSASHNPIITMPRRPGAQEAPIHPPQCLEGTKSLSDSSCDAAGCCLDAHRESCGPETWGFRHWRKQVSLRLQTVETQWSTLVQLLGLWCPLAQSVCPPDKALRAFSLLLQFAGDSWVQTKQISLPGAELISYVLHEGVLGPSQC